MFYVRIRFITFSFSNKSGGPSAVFLSHYSIRLLNVSQVYSIRVPTETFQTFLVDRLSSLATLQPLRVTTSLIISRINFICDGLKNNAYYLLYRHLPILHTVVLSLQQRNPSIAMRTRETNNCVHFDPLAYIFEALTIPEI